MAMTVKEFIRTHMLDENAANRLREESPAVQKEIINHPIEGVRNPSATVISRIHKAKSGAGRKSKLTTAVEAFIWQYGIDEKAAAALLQEDEAVQQVVLDGGPLNGVRNISAAVMGRIAKAKQFQSNTLTMSQVGVEPGAVERFLWENEIDEKASQELLGEAPDIQQAVIASGPLTSAHNRCSALIGRIRKAKQRKLTTRVPVWSTTNDTAIYIYTLMLQQPRSQSDQNYSMGMGEAFEKQDRCKAFEKQDRSKKLSPFSKTQMCKFNLLGACKKGSSCVFAHSDVELKSRPDLSRTRLCRVFIETGRCNNAEDCVFAHSEQELRATDSFCKTKMCRFWQAGRCTLGDKCRYAHSLDELREEEVSAAKAQLAQQQDQRYNSDLATNAAVLNEIQPLLHHQQQIQQLQQHMQSTQYPQQQQQRKQHHRQKKQSHQENYSACVTADNTDSRTFPIQTPYLVPLQQLIVNGHVVPFPANACPFMQEPFCPPGHPMPQMPMMMPMSMCAYENQTMAHTPQVVKPRKVKRETEREVKPTKKCDTEKVIEVDAPATEDDTQTISDMSGPASFSSHSNFSAQSPSLSQNAWSSDNEIDPVETTLRELSYNGSSTLDFPEVFGQEIVEVMPPVQRMPVPLAPVQQLGALENDAGDVIEHCSGPSDRYRNAPWRQKKRRGDVQISQAPLDAPIENEPTPGPGDGAWQAGQCAGSFEVKNTFIEFSIRNTKSTYYPLRKVRSAEGRVSELRKL